MTAFPSTTQEIQQLQRCLALVHEQAGDQVRQKLRDARTAEHGSLDIMSHRGRVSSLFGEGVR